MTTLLAFILVLGVLIFVHELGHFVTAKLAGIAVPRFSIGLGPKVWGYRSGETEYVISALPLGGYVKMAGMGEEEALEKLEGGSHDLEVPPERRFDNKSIGVRAIVISAGVIMNFLFAIVAFGVVAYKQGAPLPVIGDVFEGFYADHAGIRPGDLIVSADGVEFHRLDTVHEYIKSRGEGTIRLGIERSGERFEVAVTIGRVEHLDTTVADTPRVYQGIGVNWDQTHYAKVGALEAAGLGWRSTVFWSGAIFKFLGDLVVGRGSFRDLGGPLTIGQLSGQAARAGIATLIGFMAILSVNLAILNLLPIPILDGGHLVFLAIEAVRGRALSVEARARASQIGFLVIMAIMVWALTADFLRIAGN